MVDRPTSEELYDKGDYKKLYVLVGQLGSGTYGKVYKVQDKRTNQHVALKVIPIETGEELEEFLQEVTIMRALNHRNVIQMYAAWKKPKELAIAMELCDNGSAQDLYTRVGYRPVPEPIIAIVARETCQYLHENLVIHRDVKAANILINATGGIKLTDFGVSCKLMSASERRSSLVGTPYWLAPEVHASSYTKLPYDHKVDIWSLAISLIELADTKAPLSDLPAANAIVEIPRRPPPKLADPSAWTDEFNEFLALCLAKRPDARPTGRALLTHRWLVNNRANGEAEMLAYVEKTKRGEWGPVGLASGATRGAAAQVPVSPSQTGSSIRPSKRQTMQIMKEAGAMTDPALNLGSELSAYASALGPPPPAPSVTKPTRPDAVASRALSPQKPTSADPTISPGGGGGGGGGGGRERKASNAAAAPPQTHLAAGRQQAAARALSPQPMRTGLASSQPSSSSNPSNPNPAPTPSVLASGRLRFRELGLSVGRMATGTFNAITDVPGVLVGHTTLIRGSDVRTGVTAILPHQGNLFKDKVNAAIHVANGYGKMMGISQVNELGQIETPILLTSTLNVPRVADALLDYMLGLPGNEKVNSINVLVGETNDGQMNDIRGRHVGRDEVFSAIQSAKGGKVEEGSVGAGTGTRAFSFKGGIGTSSRVISREHGGYVVGALVQTNYGGTLNIAGVPVEADLMELLRGAPQEPREPLRRDDGSCVMVVATNAPLDSRNLERLAMRAVMGMARTGANFANGSGDYAIAFSTAVGNGPFLSNDQCSPLFEAAIEATEEAILNSLCKATTLVGKDGKPASALPLDLMVQILRKRRLLP